VLTDEDMRGFREVEALTDKLAAQLLFAALPRYIAKSIRDRRQDENPRVQPREARRQLPNT
jgi:hypothetical protein